MIPITRLALGEEEAAAAARVVRSGWLAQGEEVARLEAAVAEQAGASHAVAVSSGTAALHLCLVALGIGPGDEVVVPSLSFIATANAVLHAGATPVFADIDGRTFNVDPASVERVLTLRTRAIMPVHQLGLAADLTALSGLASRHGLLLLEDAACALGASHRGRPVGCDGPARACCFSFHPRKVITTGEGGMITTPDAALASKLRVLRSQGMQVAAHERRTAGQPGSEEFRDLGYNYRLTDVQAAVGVVQMGRLEGYLQRRRALAHRYGQLLGHLEGLTLPLEPEPQSHAFQSYMLLLPPEKDRDAVLQKLLEHGVSGRRAVTAIHLEPLYRKRLPHLSLPVTEGVARRGLMLPLFPDLTDEEQDHVARALEESLKEV